MKLHLPKRLLTALLAAFTAISLSTGSTAWGEESSEVTEITSSINYAVYEDTAYAYDVVQWTGGKGVCYGNWYVASYGANGQYSLTSSTSRDTWGEVITSADRVTLLLDGASGANTSSTDAYYDINGAMFSGIIVTAGSKITKLRSDAGKRRITLGTAIDSTSKGYTSIEHDFTLTNENASDTGDNGVAFYLTGLQEWRIAKDATFTLKTNTKAEKITHNGSLTITGSGATKFESLLHHQSGSITVDKQASLHLSSGYIQDAGAEATINGTLILNQTITNNGTLNLNGSLKVENTNIFQYYDTNADGFLNEIYYTAISGSGIVNVAEDVKIYIGDDETGADVLGNGTSQAYFKAAADANTYYVFSDSAVTSNISPEEGLTLSNIYIHSSGVLSYNSGSFNSVTIAGDGIYNLGHISKGTNFTNINQKYGEISPKWTGTVQLSGGENKTGNENSVQWIDFDLLGNANSTVEITSGNLYGYLKSGGAFATNLKLTGDLSLMNGNTGNTFNFNGKIEGAGNFIVARSGGNNNTYIFNSSVQEWTGKFEHTSAYDSDLKFARSANAINAEINRTGTGTLDLFVETSSAATFSKAVNVSTITLNQSATFTSTVASSGNVSIAADKTMTVNSAENSTIAGSLTGGGHLTKNGRGTLTLTGTVGSKETRLGTVTVGGGDLNLQGNSFATAVELTGGNLTYTGNSTHNVSGTLKSSQGSTKKLLTVESGASLTVGALNNAWGIQMTIDGVLDITGELTQAFNNSGILIEGEGEVTAGSLSVSNQSKFKVSTASLDVRGNLTISGDRSQVTLSSDSTTISGTTSIEAYNGNDASFINQLNFESGNAKLTGAVSNGGIINVTGGSVEMSGGISGSGTLNLTGGALILGEGRENTIAQLNYSGGTLTHGSLSITNAEFSGLTLANTGHLTLNGTLNIADVYMLTRGEDTYSGSSIEGNGFYTGSYIVIDGSAEGSSISYGESFAVTLGGSSVDAVLLSQSSSGLSLIVDESDRIYYVNTGIETIASTTSEKYHVAAGAKLVFDGVQTEASSKPFSKEITGAGDIVVTFNNSNHEEYVRLGESFTGILEVQGNMNLAGFQLGKHATLRLASGQAWAKSITTFANDVLLGGSTEDAFSFIGNAMTFTGKVTGSYLTTSANVTLRHSLNNINQVKVTGGTTNIYDGTYGALKQTGGTINTYGGSYGALNLAGGTINVYNNVYDITDNITQTSGILHVKSGGLNVEKQWNGTGGDVKLESGEIKLENTDVAHKIDKLDMAGENGWSGKLSLAAGADLTISSNFWLGGTAVVTLLEGATLSKDVMTFTGKGADSIIHKFTDDLTDNALVTGSTKHEIINTDLSVNSDSATTIALKLTNSGLTNAGSGTLEVTNAENTITSLYAQHGDITLSTGMSLDTVRLEAGRTLTLGGGTTHSVGTLSTGNNNSVVILSEGATLNLVNKLAASNDTYTSGNSDPKASLDLSIQGAAESKLSLALGSTDGWNDNGTINLRPLTEGGNTVADVYIREGALANAVFNEGAITNLGGANLTMADRTKLVLRKVVTGNDNFGAGKITLEGTTELNLYGELSFTISNQIESSSGSLNVTGSGNSSITFTDALNLHKLESSKNVTLSGGTADSPVVHRIGALTASSSAVTINSGILQVSSGNKNYNVKSTTVQSGATLQFASDNDMINYDLSDMTVTLNGGAWELGTGRQTLGTNFKIILKNGSISGSNAIANSYNQGSQDGYGALDFYTTGGTITSTGDSDITGGIRLRKGITIDVQSGELTIDAILNGNNSDSGITKKGAGTLTLTMGATYREPWYTGATKIEQGLIKYDLADAKKLSYGGVISGDGAIEKTGEGTLSLSGDNSFTGGTTISNGTLTTKHTTALGTGNVNITGDGKLSIDSSLNVSGQVSIASTASAQISSTDTSLNLGTTGSVKKNASDSSHVTIAANNSAASLTAKGNNVELIQIEQDASFTIADMELSNVTITAAEENTKVNLSGLSASDVQLTKGEFHMLDKAQPQVGTGGSAINLVEGGPTGLDFSTSLLNGMTLGTDASMVVDLGDLSGFTGMSSGKPTFSITLEGFSLSDYTGTGENKGLYFAADSWLGKLLVAQGASQYVKGDTLEAGAQAAAGSGSGVSVSYTSTAVGTVIIISGLQVPEPTTSTLGLIALTALVSRRRRK